MRQHLLRIAQQRHGHQERPIWCGASIDRASLALCHPADVAALTKPKRRTVPRVASDVMTSCRTRRVPERRLESEDIVSSLYRVRGMAMPQLVWVNVEPGGSAPFAANISNRLACEMAIPPGTREDELFISASAKLLKEAKRCWRYANSASFGAFADEVNLASVIESLDVSPTD